jgi:hypothetical protein
VFVSLRIYTVKKSAFHKKNPKFQIFLFLNPIIPISISLTDNFGARCRKVTISFKSPSPSPSPNFGLQSESESDEMAGSDKALGYIIQFQNGYILF